MNRLTFLLIAAGIGLSVGAAAAYKLTSDHYKAAALEQAEQMNAVSAELERTRHDKQVVYRTITKRVQTYIDRPVYLRECLDDDGVRDINAALAGRADPGEPDAAVPAAGAAGR
jgi:hypothetical protein